MADEKQRAIQRLNALLGSDLKNLDNVSRLHEQFEQERKEIEESLSLASTEAPPKVQAVIEDTERLADQISDCVRSCEFLRLLIEEQTSQSCKIEELRGSIDEITYLEKSVRYLQFIQCIEDISNKIQTSFLAKEDESAVAYYENLLEISIKVRSSKCHHLLNYLRETHHFWYDHLKDKFSKEFNEVLKTIKWPFTGSNASAAVSQPSDVMVRFTLITEYLLRLQVPKDATTESTVTSTLLTDFASISLPIALLIRPLKQRFIYHFSGAKQTNRQDKPEWFFTQILTWIKSLASWVHKHVQPVANILNLDVNAKVEFMRGLVQLAVEKVHSELSIVQYDDALFAHLVDESLGFERELRDSLLYPQNQPGVVFVLTQAHIFVKWINIEKKYATEKMDAILSSETAWDTLTGASNDGMKVTECAEAFLTLLMTITDRYSHLPQPGHRLQFLELQLELIDDWRVRLLQLLHEEYTDPLSSIVPKILNTQRYVSSVLVEWADTVHFIQLHFFKKQFEAAEFAENWEAEVAENIAEEDGSVFSEVLVLLERLEKELIEQICDSLVMDVKAKSRPYRTDKWFAMQSEKEISSLSLTPSGCAMFHELATCLRSLHELLARSLFTRALKKLAGQFDQYLLEEVVLTNRFNSGGAAQFRHDIFRNLFPLFGLYISKPDSHFPLYVPQFSVYRCLNKQLYASCLALRTREACSLLNMALGSAMLLMEALETDENTTEVLADVGIYKLPLESVLAVLKTRTDVGTSLS
ncbi:RAD50-interacting protein 1 isoform X2 [Orussus abietinus]|uniref:RAD50-interacting protein 1 isoform X2 n=1 Tax=Orussus abietinus TaxID=222816 RepID=UPI000626DDB0|nr:RAD50-interacting protein 1 isoform X2 [Orussus abietinus]